MTLRHPDTRLMATIVGQAREYAELSHNHTHDYEGWEDKHKKIERIMLGRIGQGWLRAVCELNAIPFADDTTDYTENDAYDLMIGGNRIDVKTWKASGVAYQVNAALRRHPVEHYIFLKNMTNDVLNPRIIPQGCVDFETFWKRSIHIPYGQQIPGTQYFQRYRNGSNILVNITVLTSVDRALHQFAGHMVEEQVMLDQAFDSLTTISEQKPIDWDARQRKARAFLRQQRKPGQAWVELAYDYEDK